MHEVKNNYCLFERLFKVKKNDVFLFVISFFRFRDIYISLYYANQESDDIKGGSTKMIKYGFQLSAVKPHQ